MPLPRLNYANVAATIAVVIAFGGTASLAGGTTAGPTASETLGAVHVYKKKVNLPSPTPLNYSGKFTVLCPAGEQAIAGGGLGSIDIHNSYPSTTSSGSTPLQGQTFAGWTVSGGTTPLLIGGSETVFVVCVD